MLRSYVRLVIFAVGLLLGIQLPAFVEQYRQRVNAHFLEAETLFSGFQKTANRHFNGDVDAMLHHHEDSHDATFAEEAISIRVMWQRLQLLHNEFAAMQRAFLPRAFHVLFMANTELMNETRQNYSYTVPLTIQAITSGVMIALLSALLADVLLMAISWLFLTPLKRQSRQ